MTTPDITPAAEGHRRAKLEQIAALCAESAELAFSVLPELPESPARETVYEASCAANDARNLLARVIAKDGQTLTANTAGALDLGALRLLDSPAARRLLDALREAQALAEIVDAERGNALSADIPLQPGESRGTDFAESLSELLLKLSVQIGARGDGRE